MITVRKKLDTKRKQAKSNILEQNTAQSGSQRHRAIQSSKAITKTPLDQACDDATMISPSQNQAEAKLIQIAYHKSHKKDWSSSPQNQLKLIRLSIQRLITKRTY